jgi:hypothetical protein
MMFEELAGGVRTINFKAVGRAAELLQQAKIMECSADKQKLHIKFFPCLRAKLICPEEDAVRMVEQQRRAELSEKSGSLASQLSIRYSILYALKLRRRCWDRDNCFGPPKRRPCLHGLTAGCCNSAGCTRSACRKRTSVHLLSPSGFSPPHEPHKRMMRPMQYGLLLSVSL